MATKTPREAAAEITAKTPTNDKQPTMILGIETSCDDTAVAIVADGRRVLAEHIASQDELNRLYGGVVPELASRRHLEMLVPVTKKVLRETDLTWSDLSGVAVTYGPGLAGALLTGLSFAKALTLATGLPLIGVNHLAGHIAANYIDTDLEPPFLALVVSGGNSQIVRVNDYVDFEIRADTRDDAAGEVLDKIARELGLGFPGGAAIDAYALKGIPTALDFPRARLDTGEFSYSGLKTAALQWLRRNDLGEGELREGRLADFCASYMQAVVDPLIDNLRAELSASGYGTLGVSGGVSASRFLRCELQILAEETGIKLHIPAMRYCTDNAAMIAAQGYFQLKLGSGIYPGDLDAVANLTL